VFRGSPSRDASSSSAWFACPWGTIKGQFMPIPLPEPNEPPLSDVAHFSAIYTREFHYVWWNVRRLGIPPRDLPDVTHDVFLVVLKNLWKFDDCRPFRAWLFGVLFRVTSDHLRLARNHREILDLPPELSDGAPLPDATAETQEQWRIVSEALATLDVRHRAVLIMHDFDGHTGRDIAHMLGVSLKTVYNRLYAARQHLRNVAEAAPQKRLDLRATG
jgi:RNA polymerase sigma-70 factor (ECF subfamily)